MKSKQAKALGFDQVAINVEKDSSWRHYGKILLMSYLDSHGARPLMILSLVGIPKKALPALERNGVGYMDKPSKNTMIRLDLFRMSYMRNAMTEASNARARNQVSPV